MPVVVEMLLLYWHSETLSTGTLRFRACVLVNCTKGSPKSPLDCSILHSSVTIIVMNRAESDVFSRLLRECASEADAKTVADSLGVDSLMNFEFVEPRDLVKDAGLKIVPAQRLLRRLARLSSSNPCTKDRMASANTGVSSFGVRPADETLSPSSLSAFPTFYPAVSPADAPAVSHSQKLRYFSLDDECDGDDGSDEYFSLYSEDEEDDSDDAEVGNGLKNSTAARKRRKLSRYGTKRTADAAARRAAGASRYTLPEPRRRISNVDAAAGSSSRCRPLFERVRAGDGCD